MREFFRTMVHHLEAGEPVILVSLLSSSGSTPRGAGAMMACFPGGSAGTLGGGTVEFTAQNLAKELLVSRENALRSYRFTPGDAASLGMVCGGDVTVHFQYLDPADTAAVAALRRLVELSGGGQGLGLLRRLAGERVTETRVLTEGEAPELAAYLKDATLFQDGILTIPVSRPGTVWLFGGGHVSQALAAVLAPLDFRVAVYDGKYHPVDSNEMAFKIAARMAFREAMNQAKPVLLEPVMRVEVHIPHAYTGDITGDLNHKRGRILGMDMEEGMEVVQAEVPLAEMHKYATELRSMTQGRGSFEMRFVRYEQVPANVAAEVIAKHQQETEAE